jgi:hypothetical protein
MYGNYLGAGVLQIPLDRQGELADMISAEYAKGCTYALTENRAGVGYCPFYVDADVTLSWVPDTSHLLDLVRVMVDTTASYFPELCAKRPDDLQATVAVCGLRKTEQDGRRIVKFGVHVYFPHLPCTPAMMLEISEGIIHAAADRLGPRWAVDFRELIDQGVYEGEVRGLRWVWQHKTKGCKGCAGKRKVAVYGGPSRPCPECAGRGSVIDDHASMYVPVARIKPGGQVVAVPLRPAAACDDTPFPAEWAPTPQLLRECSLRSNCRTHPAPWYQVPVGAPAPRARTYPATPADPSTSAQKVELKPGSVDGAPKRAALLDAIRHVHAKYAGCQLGKVTVKDRPKGRGPLYTVRLDSTSPGRTYCQNVARTHEHATVYFEVDSAGVVQRCSGQTLCSKYVSCVTPLTTEQTRVLFPQVVSQRESSSTAMWKDGATTPGFPAFRSLAMSRSMDAWPLPCGKPLERPSSCPAPLRAFAHMSGNAGGGAVGSAQHPDKARLSDNQPNSPMLAKLAANSLAATLSKRRRLNA